MEEEEEREEEKKEEEKKKEEGLCQCRVGGSPNGREGGKGLGAP